MMDPDGKLTRKTNPEDRKSLPSCTGEGRKYIIECLTCRKAGIRKVYLGETSRSSYQRAKEHQKYIKEMASDHPLVIHCLEDHEGEFQPVL